MSQIFFTLSLGMLSANKTNLLTSSGNNQLLRLFEMCPALLNIISDDTIVPHLQRHFLAKNKLNLETVHFSTMPMDWHLLQVMDTPGKLILFL